MTDGFPRGKVGGQTDGRRFSTQQILILVAAGFSSSNWMQEAGPR